MRSVGENLQEEGFAKAIFAHVPGWSKRQIQRGQKKSFKPHLFPLLLQRKAQHLLGKWEGICPG